MHGARIIHRNKLENRHEISVVGDRFFTTSDSGCFARVSPGTHDEPVARLSAKLHQQLNDGRRWRNDDVGLRADLDFAGRIADCK